METLLTNLLLKDPQWVARKMRKTCFATNKNAPGIAPWELRKAKAEAIAIDKALSDMNNEGGHNDSDKSAGRNS